MTDAETSDARVHELRAEIAATDQEMVTLIARRLDLVHALGAEKMRRGIAAADPAREAEVLRAVSTAARTAGLPSEPVRDMFWCLIELCRSAQIHSRV